MDYQRPAHHRQIDKAVPGPAQTTSCRVIFRETCYPPAASPHINRAHISRGSLNCSNPTSRNNLRRWAVTARCIGSFPAGFAPARQVPALSISTAQATAVLRAIRSEAPPDHRPVNSAQVVCSALLPV